MYIDYFFTYPVVDSLKGPIVPMLQTPKIPLVIVRYAYYEGRPEACHRSLRSSIDLF